MHTVNTKHASKQTCNYDHISDFYSLVGAIALES